MTNPVNKPSLNAKINIGGTVKVNLNVGGSAKASENQNRNAIQSLNHTYTQNPNNARPEMTARDAKESPQARAENKNNVDSPPVKDNQGDGNQQDFRNNRTNGRNNEKGEDGTQVNRRERGEKGDSNASEQGILNGRGHHKSENTERTPPIIVNPNEEKGNQTGKTPRTPPIIVLPEKNGEHNGGNQNSPRRNIPPVFFPQNNNYPNNQRNDRRAERQNDHSDDHSFGRNYSVNQNVRSSGNHNGVVRQVLNQVLRQNDIYLSSSTLNRLTEQKSSNTSMQLNIPREVNVLVQNISRQVVSLLQNSSHQDQLIHDIAKQISSNIHENVQSAKQIILKSSGFDALPFKSLNVQEKLHVAVDLLPRHLPQKTLDTLQNQRTPDIINGLLLARGLVSANEQPADVRNLVASKAVVLPQEISITALRDVGQLVKGLIAETATAKTTPNLDLAVQKFVRILIANNELGVLLATINLASQTQNQGGLISRSLALVQIYDLINRLIQAGEKSLQEAAPEKIAITKDRNIFQTTTHALKDDPEETKLNLNKLHSHETVSGLRQFLEFNPALMHDKTASAFNSREDAHQAQKDFVNFYHNDIENWLKSGNHRFVKDFELEKPVGVVIERGSDAVFSANTARFVLVRDGSVQGWHFLKSFLVK